MHFLLTQLGKLIIFCKGQRSFEKVYNFKQKPAPSTHHSRLVVLLGGANLWAGAVALEHEQLSRHVQQQRLSLARRVLDAWPRLGGERGQEHARYAQRMGDERRHRHLLYLVHGHCWVWHHKEKHRLMKVDIDTSCTLFMATARSVTTKRNIEQ